MIDIVVVGSINMDLVVYIDHRPRAGETVKGRTFRMIPGGKGANQAVAAARLGAKVAMVGCVGKDMLGDSLLKGLEESGVDISLVQQKGETSTGVAFITVDTTAENSIIIVPGANGLCTPKDIEVASQVISQTKILMLQLEIPLETVEYAARVAKEKGRMVILDPAPAQSLPSSLLNSVDILTPNETEAEVLTGRKVMDIKTARLAAADLLGMGVKTVLLKLGSKGVLWAEGNLMEHYEAFQVEAVDTTAAGDAFNAGLAVGLAHAEPLNEAIKLGMAAGALATTRFGAQTSLPRRSEVERLLMEYRY